jgi:hypothetical protein
LRRLTNKTLTAPSNLSFDRIRSVAARPIQAGDQAVHEKRGGGCSRYGALQPPALSEPADARLPLTSARKKGRRPRQFRSCLPLLPIRPSWGRWRACIAPLYGMPMSSNHGASRAGRGPARPEAEVVRPLEQRLVPRARVTGRGASLEGDPACVARKRAVTQQPADRGGVDIVGPRYIRLRLASGKALHGFLALARRHLARTTEAHAARLCALATFACAGADKLALELGEPTDVRRPNAKRIRPMVERSSAASCRRHRRS